MNRHFRLSLQDTVRASPERQHRGSVYHLGGVFTAEQDERQLQEIRPRSIARG